MPFGFSTCFRKGDVGGERGFEAALAVRVFAAAASDFEGDTRKTNIIMHRTTPTMIVSGLERRSDRAGPMAPYYCWASPNQYMVERCLDLLTGHVLRIVDRHSNVAVDRFEGRRKFATSPSLGNV